MQIKIDKIILASASPFRTQLLKSTGLKFEARAADIDEHSIVGAYPDQTALERGLAKAKAVASQSKDALIIGSDQVLSVEKQVLSKPQSAEAAFEQLKLLSGKIHSLFTSVALVAVDSEKNLVVVENRIVPVHLKMRKLCDQTLERYVATNEWQGCVGGYRLEERGAHLFEGDDLNRMPDSAAVMGLPIVALLEMLRKHNIDTLLSPEGPWLMSS